MKRIILTLLATAFLAVGVMAQADPQTFCPGGMRGHGNQGWDDDGAGPGMFMWCADELKLTDQQKTQMEQLTEKHAIERIDKKAALEKAELQLRHLQMKDAPEKDILAAMDKVGQLRTDMQKMRYQHHQNLKALLTPEQLEKAKTMRQECGRMGRGGCDRSGSGRGAGMKEGGCPHGRGMGQGDGQGQGGRI